MHEATPPAGDWGREHEATTVVHRHLEDTAPQRRAPSDLARAALDYAARGWHVLPVEPRGKAPLTPHGVNDASTDPVTIEAWWRQWPDANIGLALGQASGIVVLDVDDPEALRDLEAEHGPLPATVSATTGRGQHYYFRCPPGGLRTRRIAPGVELRGDGAYVVVPPSLHPSGKPYQWETAPDEAELTALPGWLLDRPEQAGRQRLGELPDVIVEGQRTELLFRYACKLRGTLGMSEAEILASLRAINAERCQPPLPDDEVRKIARSVMRYPAETVVAGADGATAVTHHRALADVLGAFQAWLYLPDPAPVELALGAYVANHLPGDPVWLLFVGPPGSGKTEIVQALAEVPHVVIVGTLTEAALLSGTSRRERATDASGGLLRRIGDFGILAPKDFGSVLSMARESRSQVLAALREIYDGRWVRHVGVDGGRTLEWRGKCGLIGGATPAIDQHHAVLAILGERFLYLRMPEDEREERARLAIAHADKGLAMRAELASVVRDFLAALTIPNTTPAISEAETERLIALADLATLCRAPVSRDPYRREIEDVPGPEMPTRMAISLRLLFGGLLVIGCTRERAWELVTRVALDSMPALRAKVLHVLQRHGTAMETTEIATELGLPTVTARRALEDLACYGIVDRLSRDDTGGRADEWRLSEATHERLRKACVSEILPIKITPHSVRENFGNEPPSGVDTYGDGALTARVLATLRRKPRWWVWELAAELRIARDEALALVERLLDAGIVKRVGVGRDPLGDWGEIAVTEEANR